MKKILLVAAALITGAASAQNSTISTILEGGKTLAALVSNFKASKAASSVSSAFQSKDSCSAKGITDFSVKNNTGQTLLVSLYKRNGSAYDAAILTMRVLPKKQEWLYEIKSGIYKMKLETEKDNQKMPVREGEIKLNPCENKVENVKTI